VSSESRMIITIVLAGRNIFLEVRSNMSIGGCLGSKR
jgi:hypothetical protein